MFFDPRPAGADVAAEDLSWKPERGTVARRGPANDFLTLPDVARAIPARPSVKWRTDPEVAKLAGLHFDAGSLKASDVQHYEGAGHAVAQALFSWVGRQCGTLKRLHFHPVLLDAQSVGEQIQYQDNAYEFEGASPLYLGLESGEEYVYVIEDRAAALAVAHPRLLATALVLINRASFRTVLLRTPDDFVSMFAQWNWDGDPWATDEDAVTQLKERFGDDPEEYQHYLPSVAREELCPDSMRIGHYDIHRHLWRSRPALGIEALRRLGWTQTGWICRLCAELEHLTLLLNKAGKRPMFDWSFRPETVYAAASIAAFDSSYIGDVLDTHYEYFNSGGDGSLFHGFVALATSPDSIRKQYADFSLGFSILRQVDRVASLITRDL